MAKSDKEVPFSGTKRQQPALAGENHHSFVAHKYGYNRIPSLRIVGARNITQE
ncbi:hypothetical protein [Dysgonomonas capnocytophagoides]|uniref:hypothetical protein n=1 Tax=Dysgonomonas capnocytophagoides TaxID=45254 RepID=UPI00334057BD